MQSVSEKFLSGILITILGANPLTGAARTAIRPVVGRCVTVKVAHGDKLQSIARSEDVNAELLSELNFLQNERVIPRRSLVLPSLRILPSETRGGIILNIPEREVSIFRGGQMKAAYDVNRIVRKKQGCPGPLNHGKNPSKPHVKQKSSAQKGATKKAAQEQHPNKPAKGQQTSKAGVLPIRPAPSAREIELARHHGALLLAGYHGGSLKLIRPERELPELEQLARDGYLTGPDNRLTPIAPQLTTALSGLLDRSLVNKPLVLLSLVRPLSPGRPNEPHGNGMAADIAGFGGHTIDSHRPGEAAAGVVAVLRALAPGHYRLGMPKPLHTDPLPFLSPPVRPKRWPFFPAPVPEVTQLGSATIVYPRLLANPMALPSKQPFQAHILRWENERGAPITALGDARLRAAINAARHRGAEVAVAFPDAVDHLHLDVVPAGTRNTQSMPQSTGARQ